jgi:syntaxin 1B/2/3
MAPLAQNGSQFGRGANPNQILNDCRDIDAGIDEADRQILPELQMLQNKIINDANASSESALNRQLENQSSQLMSMYRDLVGKLKTIKQMPESGLPKNAPQVQRVDRKLKKSMEAYRQADADYRRRLQEQMARQYRIVRPDASEQEVRAVVAADPSQGQQVFKQAMMQSDRQGQVGSTMDAVRLRHEAIQNIERQMIELAELFKDVDNLVMQQEAAVTNIEMKGEEVVEHMDKGNQEIGTAIVHARNTRKWKWWCLCITVLIIVIIAAGVAGWYFTLGPGAHKNTKRFVITDLPSHRVLSGNPWSPPSTAAKPVVPGVDWTPSVKRAVRSFIA